MPGTNVAGFGSLIVLVKHDTISHHGLLVILRIVPLGFSDNSDFNDT